jgi:hypothetical protein
MTAEFEDGKRGPDWGRSGARAAVGKKSEPGDLVPCTVILYIEINRVPGCTGMLSGWLYNHANCMWRHNNYNIPKTSKNIL